MGGGVQAVGHALAKRSSGRGTWKEGGVTAEREMIEKPPPRVRRPAVQASAVLAAHRVALGKSFPLSGPQFSNLTNGDLKSLTEML